MNRTLTLVTLAALLTVGACKKQAPLEEARGSDFAQDGVKSQAPQSVQQMVQNFQRVHFAYDSSTLTEESKRLLAQNVAIMQKHPNIGVEVQGHCDERGTIEYNLALGQRRAEAVRKYMISQGISKDRVQVISYGKERPLERSGTETAWAKNRRSEFRISWGGDGMVDGTI